MTALFARVGRWPYVVLSLLVFLAFQQFVVLPAVQRFEQLTGGVGVLETPGMLSRDLYAVATTYPTEALDLYRDVIQPLDIVLPLLLGVALVVTLSALTVRLFPADSPGRLLPLLGVLPTLFDWAENLGVAAILRTTDDPIAWLDPTTRTLSAIKIAAGAPAILGSVGLAVALAVRTVRQRRGRGIRDTETTPG